MADYKEMYLKMVRETEKAVTLTEQSLQTLIAVQQECEEMTDYSLWGGSAGARMAAWLGSYGTAAFGEDVYPQPGAVIMQYTGLSEVTGTEPPTYNCVGTSDGIAYHAGQDRSDQAAGNGCGD